MVSLPHEIYLHLRVIPIANWFTMNRSLELVHTLNGIIVHSEYLPLSIYIEISRSISLESLWEEECIALFLKAFTFQPTEHVPLKFWTYVS